MRAVVNVSTGERYRANRARLAHTFGKFDEHVVTWWFSLPPSSPTHEETPYGFKACALDYAAGAMGFDRVLWADSSIIPLRSLSPLWELIESQGYWFSSNLPYGKTSAEAKCWMTGQWTSDAALPLLGITREESFTIPHVIATAFGLDLRHDIARQFLSQYLSYARDGRAFRGPWTNESHQASSDSRVLGHRHDQTAASVIAWRLGMKLTTPPEWIVDGIAPTPSTILEIQR